VDGLIHGQGVLPGRAEHDEAHSPQEASRDEPAQLRREQSQALADHDWSRRTEVAFLDLFDPGFQPDAPQVYVAREAYCYARTALGYAVLRSDEVAALLRDRCLRQGSAEAIRAACVDSWRAHTSAPGIPVAHAAMHGIVRRSIAHASAPTRGFILWRRISP
jgi:hypothetical protein